MIVIRGAAGLILEPRINKTDPRETAPGAVRQELSIRTRNAEVLRTPKRREWSIVEIIFTCKTGSLEPVPDGRQRRWRVNVMDAVGLRCMLVEAVGISLGENGCEVVIANRPTRSSGA